MKRFILLAILFPAICTAQPGYINTIAGNGTSGFSGDGGPALSAQMGQSLGVAPDIFGNVYVADDDHSRVRKVSPSGIITTVAGGGNNAADGIPATSAGLDMNATGMIKTDVNGDLYLGDGSRVRKVDHITGIITTVAGTTTPGYSGDGGPATAAQLASVAGLCFDAAGNLYIGDQGNHRIRKVNTSGIISTCAGSGNGGFSGDGGPATAANLESPDGVCADAAGNLYVADRYNYRIRKIDASGIISTYAGSGSPGYSGDGGPAIAASFAEPSNVCMDGFGNLYISDFHNGRVRKVDQAGIVTTYVGGGGSLADGILATTASFGDIWGIAIDWNNNIYVADRGHYRVRKVDGLPNIPTAVCDSFSVYINSVCDGPVITVVPAHYSASLTLKTWFGDGHMQTDTFSANSGNAWLTHAYSYPGTYTIKHILYNGALAIDSVSSSYTYVLCKTMPLEFFYDANGNCIKDNSDIAISQPLLVEVDSNNMPIDSMSAASGLYYTAYGAPGDVYSFKVVSAPAGFVVTCPVGGIVYDTLGALSIPSRPLGLQCNTSTSFDLAVSAIIPVTGVHDQWGNIYVQNNYCQPVNGTLTLHYSPKYDGIPTQITPAAASVTGNSIVWNLNALTSTEPGPINLHYSVWTNAVYATIGDTVHTTFEITPIAGDTNATNNTVIIIDTIKSGCDPNEMWVSPAHCIPSAVNPVQLKYTINFENTGNDTAHNIYVLDTLPANIDVSTMRIVMSSHQMYVSKTKDAAGDNILKFDFPQINLLDSSHHGKCDGAVIFNINTKPGLVAGNHVYNRAGIYFDINDVVMTNQVDNLIGCFAEAVANTQAAEDALLVYPSPANDVLTISADKQTFESYTIINSVGKVVLSGELGHAQTAVNVKALAQGLYFVQMKGKDGSLVRKFLKM